MGDRYLSRLRSEVAMTVLRAFVVFLATAASFGVAGP